MVERYYIDTSQAYVEKTVNGQWVKFEEHESIVKGWEGIVDHMVKRQSELLDMLIDKKEQEFK